MKFRIDRKFMVVQLLKAIVGYLLGVLLVLWLLNFENPSGFVGTSLVAGIVMYFIFFFPRAILVNDEVISFVEKYGSSRSNVELTDIVGVETSHKLYNTVAFTTKSGKKYQLHPQDAQALASLLKKQKN